ncbi:MAG: glutamine--fructose-6-phosphate transaminase (isomerizing) [Coxiellaceae bacterium]|nr:glutamine--fructose-6-phosphate transaminase (isomerizing) [Coxiellaceae bacterium]
MCGIVGAVAQRNIAQILLEGLKRLEYRGYDSAGMAIIHPDSHQVQRIRAKGKVERLADMLNANLLQGQLGIAHTRWATHGQPNTTNAHPHFSNDTVAVVHNGIIENHVALRQQMTKLGYEFQSETDSEVIAHMIHHELKTSKDLHEAIEKTIAQLDGAYALGIVCQDYPEQLYAVRKGSPLVIGKGIGENFIASDPLALLPVTQQFIYLEDDDIAEITIDKVTIYHHNEEVDREVHTSDASINQTSKGKFRHFMQKEIFEQGTVIHEAYEGHLLNNRVIEQSFGHRALEIFQQVERVTIVACGTSYHAALTARYWLEGIAGIPCQVEVASENRYRNAVVEENALYIALSQSGETADTLAAMRKAKSAGYLATLAICNAPESSLVREADLAIMTRAGTEIGVAATKTFSNQLVSLALVSIVLGRKHGIDAAIETTLCKQLLELPGFINNVLKLDNEIKQISKRFRNKTQALFLGRGEMFPIALEGALKLKEISYIHAEAYPAGELKHGPLALVDTGMPVIVVAPKNNLLEKLQSNIQEVQARGGEVIVFADESIEWPHTSNLTVLPMPKVGDFIAPVIYNIPLQLLAYHVAVLKGTDVDQPRNLAKSVTVE